MGIKKLLAQQVELDRSQGMSSEMSSRAPVQVDGKLWMNGRLFYHLSNPFDGPERGPEAWHDNVHVLSRDLEVGWWCHFKEMSTVLSRDLRYVIFKKPYWLAQIRGE